METAEEVRGQAKDAPRRLLICLCLFLITTALYAPARNHEFIHLDDNEYVTENPHVRAGLSVDTAVWAFSRSHSSNWHPLTWLSHAVDCQLWGLNAGAHHLTNVAFHAANSVLLFLVLHAMTGATWRSAFVSALFAWHPMHVESVAWVAERKDVLSTFFWILTMLAYHRYVRNPRWQQYLLVIACYALGLMCKPMLVTLPFVLLLLDYWPLRRLPGQEEDSRVSTFRHLLVEKIPLFLLAGASSVVTFVVQESSGSVIRVSLPVRLANAAVSYVAYIGKMIWPENLAVLYPYRMMVPALEVIGAGLLLACITALVLRFAKRSPYVAVGWFWYLGTLVPVIGVVQVGAQSMADRYTYVPFIGLFIIGSWGIGGALNRLRFGRTVAACGAFVVLVLLISATSRQIGYWSDSISLFEHSLSVAPGSSSIHNNLGTALYYEGKSDEATAHFRKALELNPSHHGAHHNLANILQKEGKLEEAIAHYETALRLDPGYIEAHNNLANILKRMGKLDEAVAHYETALSLDPDYADGHYNLGNTLLKLGRVAEAIDHYEAALRLEPGYVKAHLNLGYILAAEGRMDAAIASFREAARLKDDPVATTALANALNQAGRLEEAATQYSEVLRLKPDSINALNNLAWFRATYPEAKHRNGPEAVRLAERAAELTRHNQPRILGTLAAALAEAGRFDEAVRIAEKARDLAGNDAQFAAETEERADLYRQRLPYRTGN